MAWTATTTPVDRRSRPGDILSLPVVTAVTIYKGDFVRLTTAGYAVSTTAPTTGDMFAGVAMETVANTGASGAKRIKVRCKGVFSCTLSDGSGAAETPTQSHVGTLAYLDNDSDGLYRAVSTTATDGNGKLLKVGAIVGMDAAAGTVDVILRPFRSIGLAA